MSMDVIRRFVDELTPATVPARRKPGVGRVLGTKIVVLTNGFVYVGSCRLVLGWLHIDKAKNIRVWGTSRGLGELRNGPTESTKADEAGSVMAPLSAVVHLISSDWKI